MLPTVSLRAVTVAAAVVMAALGLTGCSRTAEGVKADTSRAVENVKAGLETIDVKTALLSDATLDASRIDVDTYADRKLVVLRGSVPTAAQKDEAGRIARQEAPGYRIDNQLAVAPR
jgi:osmotically-inducible protein OsmY